MHDAAVERVPESTVRGGSVIAGVGSAEIHPSARVELDFESRLEGPGLSDTASVQHQLEPTRGARKHLVAQPGDQGVLVWQRYRVLAHQSHIDVASARFVGAQTDRTSRVRSDQVFTQSSASGLDQFGKVMLDLGIHT